MSTSSHPTELLAAFVDGTVAEGERAALTQHLQTCEQCRGEVTLARAARDALAALPEVPAPAGLAQSVTTRTSAPRQWNQRASRVVWAAAAAAMVAIVAWVGIRAANNVSAPTVTNAASAPLAHEQGTPDPEPGIFDTDGNYDAGELAALTVQAARQGNKGKALESPISSSGNDQTANSQATKAPAAGIVPSPSPAPSGSHKDFFGSTQTGSAATVGSGKSAKCFNTVGAFDKGGELQRVVDAKYEGTPAYIGVFFEPPPEGGALDRAVTWVVAKKACDLTKHKDGAILDTLACAYFRDGNVALPSLRAFSRTGIPAAVLPALHCSCAMTISGVGRMSPCMALPR
jgi:hypothetical protein